MSGIEEQRVRGVTEWWGEREIQEGFAGSWTIGPLTLGAHRRRGEWRLSHRRSDDAQSTELHFESFGPVVGDPPKEELVRVASDTLGNEIALAPALADRPVVSRLEMPLHVLSGDRATLFVSTPLWVRVQVGSPRETLLEVPVLRLADTWFGASTREGDLCYASPTMARLTLENVPDLPYRIVTKVSLENRGGDTLVLERLNLPVPFLELFGNGEEFWTQEVVVERDGDGSLATVRIGHGPPKEARECRRLASPRSKEHRGVLTRTIGALLG